MRLGSLPERFRAWRERREAMAEFRALNRHDEAFHAHTHEVLLETIKAAAFQEDAEATMKAFDQILVRAPDVAISSPTVIHSLLSIGQIDLAESVVEQGMRKYPNTLLLMLPYADIATRRRDWPEVHRRWGLLRKAFPDNYWAYVWEAASLKEMGRYDEADKLLERAILMEPADTGAASHYALVADRRGDLDEALRRWNQMRERVEDQEGWVQASRVLRRLGREGEAIEILDQARRRFPSRPEPAIELARISHSHGPSEGAAHQWRALRESYPYIEEAYTSFAQTLLGLGRRNEAEAVLAAYAARPAPGAAGLAEWARIVQQQDPSESARRWAVVREKFPDREEAYRLGAAALDAAGEAEAACDVRTRMLAKFPQQ